MGNPQGNETLDEIIRLSQTAFEEQHYQSAYHLLAAAMHLAEELGDDKCLSMLEEAALKQYTWINAHAPKNVLSVTAAQKRNGVDFYPTLIRQMKALQVMIRARHFISNHSASRPDHLDTE